jgi:hypothetical protein
MIHVDLSHYKPMQGCGNLAYKTVLEQKLPYRTKKSSTCLHLMMHIFMVHGVDPLVEEVINSMYDGNGRWIFINPPSGNSKSMDTSLLGHFVIPPRHGQVDKHKIQAPIRNEGIKCTYSKVLRIKVIHTMIPGLITSWSKNHL